MSNDIATPPPTDYGKMTEQFNQITARAEQSYSWQLFANAKQNDVRTAGSTFNTANARAT